MLYLVLTPIPKILVMPLVERRMVGEGLGSTVDLTSRTKTKGQKTKEKSEIKERNGERGKYIFPPRNLRFGDRDSAERFFVERGIPSLVLNEFNLI